MHYRSCFAVECSHRHTHYMCLHRRSRQVGIDFSASLEASSLPRGSRSSDLRQLKRRGRTAARDGAARLRLPLWRTGPVTVWGAGGRPPKVAAMGMSRSWRGGAVLPPGRQDLGHQRVCDVQRRSARDPCPHAVSGPQMAPPAATLPQVAAKPLAPHRVSYVWLVLLLPRPPTALLALVASCCHGSTPWRTSSAPPSTPPTTSSGLASGICCRGACAACY